MVDVNLILKSAKMAFLLTLLKEGQSKRIEGDFPPYHCDKWHELLASKVGGTLTFEEVHKQFDNHKDEMDLLNIGEFHIVSNPPAHIEKKEGFDLYMRRMNVKTFFYYWVKK